METRAKQIERFDEESGFIDVPMTVSVRTSGYIDHLPERHTYTSLMLAFKDGYQPSVYMDEHGQKSVRLQFDHDEGLTNLIESLEFAVKSLKEMANKNN